MPCSCSGWCSWTYARPVPRLCDEQCHVVIHALKRKPKKFRQKNRHACIVRWTNAFPTLKVLCIGSRHTRPKPPHNLPPSPTERGSIRPALKRYACVQSTSLMEDMFPELISPKISSDSRFGPVGRSQPKKSSKLWESACDPCESDASVGWPELRTQAYNYGVPRESSEGG